MKDPLVEKFLMDRKVQWEYRENVPLERIDAEASKRNQARGDNPNSAIEPRLVDQYARAAKKKADFPALVAWERNGDGRLVLCGGNNRLAAFQKAGRRVTDVYVVQTQEPMVIRKITVQLNQLNGERQSDDMNLAHAVDLVLRNGETPKAAAAVFQLPTSRVEYEVRYQRALRRLAENGLNARAIPRKSVMLLSGIANDPVLIAAFSLVSDSRLSEDEITSLTRDISMARSEADMLGIIRAWRERPDVAARTAVEASGGGNNRARIQIFRFVVGLTNLLRKHPTAEGLGLSLADIDSLGTHWLKAGQAIEGILSYGTQFHGDSVGTGTATSPARPNGCVETEIVSGATGDA